MAGSHCKAYVVRVAAARGDVVQVERQRDARALDGDGLGELRGTPESVCVLQGVAALHRTVTTLTSRGTYQRKRAYGLSANLSVHLAYCESAASERSGPGSGGARRRCSTHARSTERVISSVLRGVDACTACFPARLPPSCALRLRLRARMRSCLTCFGGKRPAIAASMSAVDATSATKAA